MIFCSDEESFKAEDSDERLNNSVGNLDEQIRNLSNQTIEFCQSIDEKAAIKKTIEKSNNSESRPFIEVTLPEESNSEKVLGKLSRKVSKLFGFFHLGNIRYTCRKQTYHFFSTERKHRSKCNGKRGHSSWSLDGLNFCFKYSTRN